MKVWFCLITLVLLLANDSRAASCSCQNKPQGRHVIESLPSPNDEEIQKIRTPNQWHNPYVIVDSEGYELILYNQTRNPTSLTLRQLEQILLKLPREQWPLGGVVAVQESGLRSPGDDAKIAENLKALKRMLGSHKLRINDKWPSG
jgi:hypothetical protein